MTLLWLIGLTNADKLEEMKTKKGYPYDQVLFD